MKQLYKDKYPYAINLIVLGGTWFSLDNVSTIENMINSVNTTHTDWWKYYFQDRLVDVAQEKDYALRLLNELKTIDDYSIRVESPHITIYTVLESDQQRLIDVDPQKIKFISKPKPGLVLNPGEVYMPKVPFDYKITLRSSIQDHRSFLDWADKNPDVRMTNGSIYDMQRSRSWGGTYFYVNGDENIFLVKMQLGNRISKIQRVLHD